MKLIYSVAFGIGAFFALNCGSGEGGHGSPSGGSPSAAPAPSGASAGSPSDGSVVEVKVNGHDFDPREVTIKAAASG